MAFGAEHNGLVGTSASPARTPAGTTRPRRAGHVLSAAVACVLAIGYSFAVGGGAPRGAAAAVAPPVVRQLHPNVSVWVGDTYLLAADQPAACPASVAVADPLLVSDTLVEVTLSVGGSTCDGDTLIGLHHEGLPVLVDILGPDYEALVDTILVLDPNLTVVHVESPRTCGVEALAAETVIIFFAEPLSELVGAAVILPDNTVCEMALSGEPAATADTLDD